MSGTEQRASTAERGQAFAFVALLIAFIGGMTAVAVDLGSYAADRRDLQNAADAIALAASQELPDPAATQDAADEWAEKNDIDLEGLTVTVIPQSVPSEPNPKVRVEVESEHDFTFARLIGIESAAVEAAATAIRTSPGGGAGLMPWSVEKADKDAATPGGTLVLKYDSNNVQTGNFGALRVDGSGSSTYRDSVKYGTESGLCASGVASCPYSSVVETEPGNMTGSTRTGTDYRMNNTDEDCDSWEEVVVTNGAGSHGLRPECNPFVAAGNENSLQVVIVPIINSLCNGSCDVTVVEFALFFLEGYGAGGCTGNKCEIKGRFINSNTNYGGVVGTFSEDTFAHFVRLVD